MKILKIHERFGGDDKKVDILFVPSGEIIPIPSDQFGLIDSMFEMEYSRDEKLYFMDDDLKDAVLIALDTDAPSYGW